MTNFTEGNNADNTVKNRVCHVAYTFNNHQPVSSTIIGDKPFFYMDEDIDVIEAEDSDVLFSINEIEDLENFEDLERHLLELQAEETAFDRFTDDFNRTPEQYFTAFCETKDDIFCNGHIDVTLDDVLGTLNQSRLAAAYIEYAAQNKITFKHSDQIAGVSYAPESRVVLIYENMSLSDQLLLTARTLRDIWQVAHVGTVNPLSYGPNEAILVNRLLDADAHIAMIRIAWELQLMGARDVWARLEQSCFNDLAQAFAKEAFNDFRSINNGAAATAAFEQWFLSERCKQSDGRVIRAMFADQHAYVLQGEATDRYLDGEFVVNLGKMPFGNNYLAAHAGTLLSDPLFKEVRDRSNANFLWFIKFERSFCELEQELQPSSVSTSAGDIYAQTPQGSTDRSDDNALYGAQIVTFTPPKRDKSAAKGHAKALRPQPNTNADIIYLRRWSGE